MSNTISLESHDLGDGIFTTQGDDIDMYVEWNGRDVRVAQGNSLDIHHYFSRWEESTSYNFIDNYGFQIRLCGGSVGASASADTDGNARADATISYSSEDHSFSASGGAGVSTDRDGHSKGEVYTEARWEF